MLYTYTYKHTITTDSRYVSFKMRTHWTSPGYLYILMEKEQHENVQLLPAPSYHFTGPWGKILLWLFRTVENVRIRYYSLLMKQISDLQTFGAPFKRGVRGIASFASFASTLERHWLLNSFHIYIFCYMLFFTSSPHHTPYLIN